jgi:ligand-binding sensor domain-containing protein/two-component sensor histidine kinase
MGHPNRWAQAEQWLRFFIALVAFIAPSVPVSAQLITTDISQYGHSSWLSKDGFFQGNLTSITQTADGYVWIGSGFGLIRFDGQQFLPWRPAQGQSLPTPIFKVLGTRDGSLWIGGAGLVRLKEGRMTTYPALQGIEVSAILEDRAGDVWVGGLRRGPSNHLCRIHQDHAECYGDTHSFGMWIRSLLEDKTGSLWVGSEAGLWRWRPGSPKLFPDHDKGAASSLAIDAHGSLIMAKDTAIEYLSKRGEIKLNTLRIGGKNIDGKCFLSDRNGSLWVGTQRRGLFHILGNRIDTYTGIDGLSSDLVNDIFQDLEGNVWVVTSDGVDRFRRLAVTKVTKRQGLSDNSLASVLSEGNSVWVASLDGLDRITGNSITRLGSHNGLLTKDTRTMYSEPGQFLIATGLPNGLMWRRGEHFTRLPTPSGENIFVIAPDGDSGYWLSNREKGLIHVHRGGRPVEVFSWDEFGSLSATAMAFDPIRKGLWMAFARGDLEFFQNGQVKDRYSLTGGKPFLNPRDLQVAPDGSLWVGSNAGLSRLWHGRLFTLSSQNGLPCDGVHWRKDDNNHSTWLDTPCGIIHLPPGELDRWANAPESRVHILDHFDNMDGAENVSIGHYYSPPVTIGPDGRLLFVTTSGLGVIDPKHSVRSSFAPPVHLEGIQADARSFPITGEVALPPNLHVVRISYSALDFSTPQKVRYKYRLDGYDSDWSEVLSSREAVYTRLPPGRYRFRVIACGGSGIWNEVGDSVNLRVSPAFYQTRLFLVLCLVLFTLLGWIAYMARIRFVCRRTTEHMEVQINERLQISRDLHDTLLQGVQGLVLSFYALAEGLPADSPLRMKMTKVLDSAERVIEEGRDRIKSLRRDSHAQYSLRVEILAMGALIAIGDRPAFHVSVKNKERPLNPVIADELALICREALNNAFRHAHAQSIEVLLAFGKSRLIVAVRDDGRGMPADIANAGSAGPGHWGLVNMKERAHNIGAKLEIRKTTDNDVAPGTSVVVELPSRAAYLKEVK